MDPDLDLAGRAAVVTGASRGIGAATAEALAARGCAVACAARSTDDRPSSLPGTIDATVRRIRDDGGRAVAVPTDLTVDGDAAAMVAAAVAELGRLDVLVNNAAVTFPGDLDIDLDRHELIMAVNLRAPLLAIRAAAGHLADTGGAIVNVSSAAALTVVPGLMSYGISKVALERLSVDVAAQLAGRGVASVCFRIDVPVASEGFLANAPDADHSDWEPPAVAAGGIVWTIERAHRLTGRRLSMAGLREGHGIMPTRAEQAWEGGPLPTRLQDGLEPGTAPATG